jgi:hypothetical protein
MDEFDDILLDDYNIDQPNEQSSAVLVDNPAPTDDAQTMKKTIEKVKLSESLYSRHAS